MYRATALLSLLAAVKAQQVGTQKTEVHPPLSWSTCSAGGSCTSKNAAITIDANWRWVHTTGGYANCYTGNTWDKTICTDNVACAAGCALDGADYSGTYGITTSSNALKLNFVTSGAQKNIGSRTYLMDGDSKYQVFNLLNNEFTFDVDVSNLPCGLNGALYFVSMDADGGMSKYPTNKAGAKYGTGYCDSQCPRDLKFIAGKANVEGWTASTSDVNAGQGGSGACCSEMDIWEANSVSAAYTPHPCSTTGYSVCTGDGCGGTYSPDSRYASVCDPDGCDFNSYRVGNTTFYGAGKTVDTKSKFTVVTQFITSDGTSSGTLTEIRRFYVQNGKVIPNSYSSFSGSSKQWNSITTDFCAAEKAAFGDNTGFETKGDLAGMGAAMANGMVLVMSVWDDHAASMLWLDSTYPVTQTTPGAARGECATTSGAPTDVESKNAGASVTYSNIKFGPINSTFTAP